MLSAQCQDRPITFIAHDLGGTVVKEVNSPLRERPSEFLMRDINIGPSHSDNGQCLLVDIEKYFSIGQYQVLSLPLYPRF